jgi:DNA-binding transcriptional MocR family regulator
LDKDNVPTEAREGLKFGFDSVKQLTTLSSGSIVLIGTFSKSILPTSGSGQLILHPSWLKYLLLVSFVLLGASTLLGAYATFLHTRLMRDLGEYGSHKLYQAEPQRAVLWRMVWSFWLFFFGLVCFGTLVLVSLL